MLIRDWRDMHDVSQRTMAKAIGVHVTTLSQIEHRRCDPSVPVLCRIWKYTGLSAEQLLRAFMAEQPGETTHDDAVKAASVRRRRLKK